MHPTGCVLSDKADRWRPWPHVGRWLRQPQARGAGRPRLTVPLAVGPMGNDRPQVGPATCSGAQQPADRCAKTDLESRAFATEPTPCAVDASGVEADPPSI